MRRLVCPILLAAFLGSSAVADGIRPVTLQVKEQESGQFLVKWRVPKQIPPRSIPSPELPASCRVTGERTVVERSGAWFLRQSYRCPEGISGQELSLDYPFLNVTVSTLVQVELQGGERYARMLVPGEHSWRIPQSASGGVPAWLRRARDAVVAGAAHFAGNVLHFAFALSLLLFGRLGISIRLANVFTAGQLLAVVLASFSGVRLAEPLAEIGVAVGAALLAREALRPEGERRQLVALSLCAGFAHGLGIAQWVTPAAERGVKVITSLFPVVLGMDTLLVVSVLTLSGLGRLVSWRLAEGRVRSAAAYGIGGLALALALSGPVASSAGTSAARSGGGLQLGDLPIPEGAAGSAGSRRVAARVPDAALQSFVAVEAFEVRHEALVRLRDVAAHIGIGGTVELAVEGQDGAKRSVRELIATRTTVAIDGESAEPVDVRVDFLTLDAQGALPRLSPIPEPVDTAFIGVTSVYLTASTPDEVAVRWESFGEGESIPGTVTDPESSRSVELTVARPVLRWTNELADDPAPIVTAIAVEPRAVWIPVWSLFPLCGVVLFGWWLVRGRKPEQSIAVVRVMIAFVFVLGPLGGVATALPFSVSSAPDPGQAKRILAGVLPNVYRAFEFPTESAVYDRLALSVTGETLTNVYLQNRRAVEMEERGGARARVEAVEVLSVESVEPEDAGGFVAGAVWTVGGTVTHFGHRHFRQNRYDARVDVVPIDGIWKIRSIEVLDEQRLR